MGRAPRTTATIAAVMASVLGGVELLGAVVSVVLLAGDEQLDPGGLVVIVVLLVVAAFLLAGAVSLVRRKPSAPGLVAVGAAATVVGTLVGLIAASRLSVDPSQTWESDSPAMALIWVIGCLVIAWAASMLALALLPPTRRWCKPVARVDYTAAARRLEQRVRGGVNDIGIPR